MTLYSSKDVKNVKNSILDVHDILRGWEIKLGFSIFHIFYVNALKAKFFSITNVNALLAI